MAGGIGMRQRLCVLVVDDDQVSLDLESLKLLLQKCCHEVTSVGNASALKLVMENEGKFDVLFADVDSWNVDSLHLIERLGKMLPTVLLSANVDQDRIKMALAKGACHCLVKPVQFEDLKNISHLIINRRKQCCESAAEDTRARPASIRSDRKRENENERKGRGDGKEENNVNPVPQKKPRLVWDERLKKKFEKAFNDLGPENAVPKKILELMNEPGLSRENVASHLQKYKESLKKADARKSQQAAMSVMLGSGMMMPLEANAAPTKLAGGGSGQFIRPNQFCMPTTTQPLMQHGMFGRPSFPPSMSMPRGIAPDNVNGHHLLCPQNHSRTFGNVPLNNSHPPVVPARLALSIHDAQRPLFNEACPRQFINDGFSNRMGLSGMSFGASFANLNLEQMRDQAQLSQDDLIRMEAENNMIKSFGQMRDQEDFARMEPENNMLVYHDLHPNSIWCDLPPPLCAPSPLRPPPPPGSDLALRPAGLQNGSVPNGATRSNEASYPPNNIGQFNDYLIHNGLEQVSMNNLDGCNGFPPRQGLGFENGFAAETLGGVRANDDAWHP